MLISEYNLCISSYAVLDFNNWAKSLPFIVSIERCNSFNWVIWELVKFLFLNILLIVSWVLLAFFWIVSNDLIKSRLISILLFSATLSISCAVSSILAFTFFNLESKAS